MRVDDRKKMHTELERINVMIPQHLKEWMVNYGKEKGYSITQIVIDSIYHYQDALILKKDYMDRLIKEQIKRGEL